MPRSASDRRVTLRFSPKSDAKTVLTRIGQYSGDQRGLQGLLPTVPQKTRGFVQKPSEKPPGPACRGQIDMSFEVRCCCNCAFSRIRFVSQRQSRLRDWTPACTTHC